MRYLALLVFVVPLVARAQQGDLPRDMWVSYKTTPVYADADYLADVVDTLARGDSVLATERSGCFVRVQRDSTTGWVLEANLSRTRVEPAAGGSSRHTRGKRAAARATGEPSTADTARAPATAGASDGGGAGPDTGSSSTTRRADEQCAAVTRKGTRCSRTAADGSAYCWQHGGRK